MSLDERLVQAAAMSNSAGVVLVTFANHAQLDFALNWIAHLDELGLAQSALVGATDERAVRGLERQTLAHCFPLSSEIGTGEAKWGSPGFSQMGRTKARLLRTLLSFQATVLFADADVAFLRNPLAYVTTQLAAGADVLFHTDGFGSSPDAIRTGRLEHPAFGWGPELNTGLFVATPKALPLAEAWCDAVKSDAAFANWKNDQQALNELMRKGVKPCAASHSSYSSCNGHRNATDDPDLIDAFSGGLKLGLLPSHLFPSGHVFFIQRQLRTVGVTPIAVHLTFQNCDQSGKRHRMREARLWLVDPPEHYDPPNGLLSYTPDYGPPGMMASFNASSLPPRNLRASDAVLASHFALVNHQLLQIRTALALSHWLNRTLVLPRFLCGLETVTNFAHSGVRCRGSRGCATALPYWCPADHVLRMHYIAGVMPQVPQLPLRIREHSSLRHPASPVHDPARVVFVDTNGPPARGCGSCGDDDGAYVSTAARPPHERASSTVAAVALAATRRRGARTLQLPAAELSEADVVKRLGPGSPASGAGLIHLSSLRPDHGIGANIGSMRWRDAFLDTMKPLGGGWCCIDVEQRGAPGHYWYDALWDIIPHTDRFGRAWSTSRPWKPTPGP